MLQSTKILLGVLSAILVLVIGLASGGGGNSIMSSLRTDCYKNKAKECLQPIKDATSGTPLKDYTIEVCDCIEMQLSASWLEDLYDCDYLEDASKFQIHGAVAGVFNKVKYKKRAIACIADKSGFEKGDVTTALNILISE